LIKLVKIKANKKRYLMYITSIRQKQEGVKMKVVNFIWFLIIIVCGAVLSQFIPIEHHCILGYVIGMNAGLILYDN